MIFEMMPDRMNRQPPEEQTVRGHHGENNKAYCIKTLQHQNNRHHDEEKHQVVQEGTRGIIFSPPVIGFGRTDLPLPLEQVGAKRANTQAMLRVPRPHIPSDSTVRLCAFAPECLQIVNTRRLMRAVLHTLQANFAEIGTNETGKLGGQFVDCSFSRFGNRNKEQQVDLVTVFTQLPYEADMAF